MKICLFTDSDVFAGTERHMLDLAIALNKQGNQVSVACPSAGALAIRAKEAGLDVRSVEKRGSIDTAAIRQVADWFRRSEFDIVHAHNGRCAFICALADFLHHGHWVYTQHFISTSRDELQGARRWLKQRLHCWISKRAAAIVAISNAVSNAIIKRGDTAAAKVKVVLNGIEQPLLPANSSRDEVRQQLGITQDAVFLFSAARLEKEKDLETLIAAMSAVARVHPHAVCCIAGEGDWRPQLELAIKQSGQTNHIKLLGFRTDVHSITDACDIFVLPSVAEPFGLSIVEAMALRRPVVATAAGGPLEIIEDGVSGRLVPPRDAPALTDALERLVQSRDSRIALGENGYHRYMATFTASHLADRMMTFYQSTMHRLPMAKGVSDIVPAPTVGEAKS